MAKFFNEDTIRPQALMDQQKKYLLEDLKYLQKQKGNFVEVGCPACDSKESTIKYRKYSFKYHQCKNCQTVYMSPRPTTKIIFDFLDNSKNYKYWNDVIFPASEKTRKAKIFKPRVKLILQICKKFGIPTKSLLEVGSGFGTFLEELQKQGNFKKVVGIEPSPDWAQTCRSKGMEIIQKPIESISPAEVTANVIVNFEVIEHIFSPKEFIRSCFALLEKEGILIITCPNVKGFDIQILKELSNTIDAEHLNYFHPDSLALLLESEGFTVIDKQTPGFLDADLVRNKVVTGEFKLEDDFLKTILIDRWDSVGKNFQTFLQKNLLSSNMLLVAQKQK